MAFRITPSLGPDVEQVGPYYWDLDEPRATYQLGSKVVGSDGHDYIHVTAAADIAADTAVTINEATWVATAGAGDFKTTTAVKEGEAFHARVTALA